VLGVLYFFLTLTHLFFPLNLRSYATPLKSLHGRRFSSGGFFPVLTVILPFSLFRVPTLPSLQGVVFPLPSCFHIEKTPFFRHPVMCIARSYFRRHPPLTSPIREFDLPGMTYCLIRIAFLFRFPVTPSLLQSLPGYSVDSSVAVKVALFFFSVCCSFRSSFAIDSLRYSPVTCSTSPSARLPPVTLLD